MDRDEKNQAVSAAAQNKRQSLESAKLTNNNKSQPFFQRRRQNSASQNVQYKNYYIS